MSRFKPNPTRWQDFLTTDERATVDRAEAAKIEWKRLRDVRADIASRAMQRAKAADVSRQIGANNLNDCVAELSTSREQASGGRYDPSTVQVELIKALVGSVELVRAEISQRRIANLTSCAPRAVEHPEPNCLLPILEVGRALLIEYERHVGLPQRQRCVDRPNEVINSGRSAEYTTSAECSSSGTESPARRRA